MNLISKEELMKIYPMVDEKCEICGSILEEIEFNMAKTYLLKSFYTVTAKSCPKLCRG